MLRRARFAAALAALCLAAPGAAHAAPPPEPGGNALSAAERIYSAARPKLVQVRTLLTATGQQVGLGSGFFIDARGRAITNYHVVSQAALEPATYRLEYAGGDGRRGTARIVALDVADDLALIRLDHDGEGHFDFDARPLAQLAKGERLYAMGNPLELGFSIVEGTYNGLDEKSYVPRIHFSGAINPGMSGGPAVTEEGRVVGINVSRRLGGELVSFLVPAQFAATLVERGGDADDPPAPASLRAEVSKQVASWLGSLYGAVAAVRFPATGFGPYDAPQFDAPWFTCWSQTNAGSVPKPRASIEATNCRSETRLFVSEDLSTGVISLTQSLVRNTDLNAFQFAALLSRQAQVPWLGPVERKWFTQQRCREDFTQAGPAATPLPVDAVWCARAYRQLDGIFDVAVVSVTENRSSEALVSRLLMQGVTYENATALAKRLFAGLQWAK